ncbi:hypothetical protein LCGC14_1496480 [marine sediment metagenome]|uniref:cyclic pyranopterin monophosphate synthase n=2 Tax=root TaxID=1 RepID=A0A831QQI1_9FLAO|nr:cyclic pyranopterin monophosphate synthase MoaC [Pricia sp.]HEA22558.1 cyclic pyranopterin monophosphate synthase MoaC [Pricia antarctica]
MNKELSHIDASGNAVMVDVSNKKVTSRSAIASGRVEFPSAVFDTLAAQDFLGKKGSIIQTAVIAGIQAVKKTSELIPLCHQINLSKVQIDIHPHNNNLEIRCTVKCNEKTGVEMEALTGVSISALTIYDMCKALSHDISITNIQLEEKTGGKNDYRS